MTATACCTQKAVIYQIQVISKRSQFTPILPRSNLSSSATSIISISELRSPIKTNKIFDNRADNIDNRNQSSQRDNLPIDERVDIPIDDETVENIDVEQYLNCVGLRHKSKKKVASAPPIRSLVKRLATPVCLLPMPKYGERVRQALYIVLPFLKFLSIVKDVEHFCSLNDKSQLTPLLPPRSVTQMRSTKPVNTNTNTNKRKVSKAEFVNMAAMTFRNHAKRTPMAKYIHSTIECRVVLDRLEQSTIDQIMQDSFENHQTNTTHTMSKRKRSLRNSLQQENTTQSNVQHSSTQKTVNISTIDRETYSATKEISAATCNESKRLKISNDDSPIILHDNNKRNLVYERIYLKCFVCSKRQYIDARSTNSDILHSHWLEHGNDLSLNIYDSEIDSILTRVVEFFHFPKRHTLEGKIQTVFILNSKEIQRTPSYPVDDDKCIILD